MHCVVHIDVATDSYLRIFEGENVALNSAAETTIAIDRVESRKSHETKLFSTTKLNICEPVLHSIGAALPHDCKLSRKSCRKPLVKFCMGIDEVA